MKPKGGNTSSAKPFGQQSIAALLLPIRTETQATAALRRQTDNDIKDLAISC